MKHGVIWGSTKKLGLIGSAVLTLIGYKQTNTQAKYIYRWDSLVNSVEVFMLPGKGDYKSD